MSRRLAGGIPRAFASHKSPDGAAYRCYVRAVLARLGTLPPDGLVTLREAGRLTVELQASGHSLERARAARRPRDVARLRRAMIPMRTQLLVLERRLEELAATYRPAHTSLAALLAGHEEPS